MRNRSVTLPPTLSRLAVAASGWPRRGLAALLLVCGVVLLLAQPAGSASKLTDVVVAADQLPAGTVLTVKDLRIARWPADLVPDGALRTTAAALGKPVAGSVSAGEALTAGRMLDTAISSALRPGQVAVSVMLRDPAQTAILQAGARVDLYTAQTQGLANPDLPTSAGAPVATDVQILAILEPSATGSEPANSSDAASVVIACSQTTAAQLARASSGSFLASLKPPD